MTDPIFSLCIEAVTRNHPALKGAHPRIKVSRAAVRNENHLERQKIELDLSLFFNQAATNLSQIVSVYHGIF
jgi:hypothetical protein